MDEETQKEIQDVLDEKEMDKVIIILPTVDKYMYSNTYRVLYNEDEYCPEYPLARGFEIVIIHEKTGDEYLFEYIDGVGNYVHDDPNDNNAERFLVEGQLLKEKLHTALTLLPKPTTPPADLSGNPSVSEVSSENPSMIHSWMVISTIIDYINHIYCNDGS